MATNSWSKSLRKVCLRSQSKQRDRHVAFGVLRPLRFRLAVSGTRDLVRQLVHRSASCTWMHGPEEHQQLQLKVMLQRRNVALVVLVVLGLDPTPVQVRSSCHFVYRYCISTELGKYLKLSSVSRIVLVLVRHVVVVVVERQRISNNFSSGNTEQLSTFPHQLCLKGANKEKAGPNRRERRAAARGEVRSIRLDNFQKQTSNHLKHLESAGWSPRCLKKLLAFSSPRGSGRARLQESQGI